MRPGGQEPAANAIALAMAALDVAGQLRERNPADVALFGEESGRFVGRFVAPGLGEALLARAVTDGTAESTAWLVTSSGQRCFRVALWRQRGGERIRVLAVFAHADAPPAPPEAGLPGPARETLSRFGHDLSSSLTAVSALADRIRQRDGMVAAGASEIIAAAWRMQRIAAELIEAAGSGALPPPLRLAELDLARLARRVAEQAGPGAEAVGVALDLAGMPEPGRGPAVLADEGYLWSIVDGLVQNALSHAGRGATLRIGIVPAGQGLALEIADNGPGVSAEVVAEHLACRGRPGQGLGFLRELARATGAELEVETSPAAGFTARIAFPPLRCLGAA